MRAAAMSSAQPTLKLARRLALLPFFLYANAPPPAHFRQIYYLHGWAGRIRAINPPHLRGKSSNARPPRT